MRVLQLRVRLSKQTSHYRPRIGPLRVSLRLPVPLLHCRLYVLPTQQRLFELCDGHLLHPQLVDEVEELRGHLRGRGPG